MTYRPPLAALALAIGWAGLGSPALAQRFDPPRFDALEQQRRDLAQQQSDLAQRQRDQLDSAQRQLDAERFRLQVHPGPIPPAALADRAAQLDIQRSQLELERNRIDTEQNRARIEQEEQRLAWQNRRIASDAELPNRRITSASTLVIDSPAKFNLPPAPPNTYYARLDGRFVLVDARTELPIKVLQPEFPGGARPAP